MNIVTEMETCEYLYSNDDKKFTGTAAELLQSIYKCESLPVKIRLYAATKSVDIEPRPTVEPTAEDTAAAEREAEKWREELAAEIRKHREIILERRERLLARWLGAGELNERQVGLVRTLWGGVVKHCDYHLDNQACPDGAPTADEPPQTSWRGGARYGHGMDMAPWCKGQHVEPERQNGANLPDKSVKGKNVQSERAQNGAGQPQDASNGHDIKGYIVGLPHKAFWLASGTRYEANEFGEVDVTDASPGDIEESDRHGYRARR